MCNTSVASLNCRRLSAKACRPDISGNKLAEGAAVAPTAGNAGFAGTLGPVWQLCAAAGLGTLLCGTSILLQAGHKPVWPLHV